MEGIFVILLFVGVIAITALLFGVWFVVTVLRLIFRGIAAMFMAPASLRHHGHRAPRTPMTQTYATSTIQCPSPRCRASNPSNARFCRRCGTALPPVQRVAATRRHAACWF